MPGVAQKSKRNALVFPPRPRGRSTAACEDRSALAGRFPRRTGPVGAYLDIGITQAPQREPRWQGQARDPGRREGHTSSSETRPVGCPPTKHWSTARHSRRLGARPRSLGPPRGRAAPGGATDRGPPRAASATRSHQAGGPGGPRREGREGRVPRGSGSTARARDPGGAPLSCPRAPGRPCAPPPTARASPPPVAGRLRGREGRRRAPGRGGDRGGGRAAPGRGWPWPVRPRARRGAGAAGRSP